LLHGRDALSLAVFVVLKFDIGSSLSEFVDEYNERLSGKNYGTEQQNKKKRSLHKAAYEE